MSSSRSIEKALVVGCLALLIGCSDATAPTGPLTTAPTGPLKFCTPPAWLAVKNDGSDWRFVTVSGNSASFDATPRLSIAFSFFTTDAQVMSLTADELKQLSGSPLFGCGRDFSFTKQLSGSVTGVPAGRDYSVQSPSAGGFVANTASFDLNAPDGPTDLLAVTYINVQSSPIERVIIRRDVNLPTGSVMPVFDFASAESKPLDSASLSVANAAGAVTFQSEFSTRGMFVYLRYSDTLPTIFHAVPAALLRADDFHRLTVGGCCGQKLEYYYRSATPTSVAVGPAPASASASVSSAAGCARVHVEMPTQLEYPSFARAWLAWGSRPVRAVYLTVTNAYLGGVPPTWVLDVPDLMRPDGSCLVDANTSPATYVTVGDGRIAVFGGIVGAAGESLRTAQAGATYK